MALKDLIAPKSAMAEEAIEAIVADYVRYDADEKEIVFTPAAAGLSNKAKALVYLVALQGWSFVAEEAVATEASPGHIEARVGIPGGSLRPVLKDLKDRHLIMSKGSAYSVRPVNLATIKAELDGTVATSAKPRRSRKSSVAPREAEPETVATPKARRTPASKAGNLSARFDGWIDGGFFDEPRALADVRKRFHKEGMIIPNTSIPKYLLRGIRAERLVREEADVNGKKVWVYRANK